MLEPITIPVLYSVPVAYLLGTATRLLTAVLSVQGSDAVVIVADDYL